MSPPSRRDVLRACGLGVAALAGCVGQDDPADDGTTATTRTTTPPTETAATTSETTETTEQTTTRNDGLECAPASLPDEEWPLPDRGPSNANYAPSATGPTEKPTVRWKRKAEEPDTDAYVEVRFTDPIVAGDRLYVGKVLLPGAESPMPEGNAVHAYDRATGKRVWTYPLGREPPKTVAVMDDAVYVATMGSLHAVGRRDGSRRWTFDRADEVSGVTPAGGRVFVGVGSWTDSESKVGSVRALRPDGTEAWASSVGDWPSSRPAVSDGTVFVGTDDGGLTALRAADGRERWSAAPVGRETDGYRSVNDVTATDCGVFASVNDADDALVSLARDGSVGWKMYRGYTGLSTDGATLYAGTGDGTVRALSADDGAVKWETFVGVENPRMVDGVHGDPVVADDALFVAAWPHSVVSFDADDGTERWRREFDLAEHPGKPVVADEELYLSVGAHLLVLD